eukprot:4733894-Amphidinium_carterae.1
MRSGEALQCLESRVSQLVRQIIAYPIQSVLLTGSLGLMRFDLVHRDLAPIAQPPDRSPHRGKCPPE